MILKTIDEALIRKSLSDAAASKLAVGHPSLIKNFRMPRSGEKRYNLSSLKKLADVLDLELYFGPPRDHNNPPSTPEEAVDHLPANFDDLSLINLYDVQAAAGVGRINANDTAMSAIAFPKNWLRQRGITPQNAALIYVAGDSMEPTLPNGAMVMIDRSRTKPDRRKIHVFREGDQLCVKRLERIGKTGVLITSDNPDHSSRILEHPAQSDFEIIGEVVWAGHSKIS